jgi:hypothetical protein
VTDPNSPQNEDPLEGLIKVAWTVRLGGRDLALVRVSSVTELVSYPRALELRTREGSAEFVRAIAAELGRLEASEPALPLGGVARDP